jgi:hypothetical protein
MSEKPLGGLLPTNIPEMIGLVIRTAPNLIGLILLALVLHSNYQSSEARRVDITDRYLSFLQCDSKIGLR